MAEDIICNHCQGDGWVLTTAIVDGTIVADDRECEPCAGTASCPAGRTVQPSKPHPRRTRLTYPRASSSSRPDVPGPAAA